MADRTNQDERVDGAATADYLATMAADLAAMARANGLEVLGYLFDVARLEAEEVVRRSRHVK